MSTKRYSFKALCQLVTVLENAVHPQYLRTPEEIAHGLPRDKTYHIALYAEGKARLVQYLDNGGEYAISPVMPRRELGRYIEGMLQGIEEDKIHSGLRLSRWGQ